MKKIKIIISALTIVTLILAIIPTTVSAYAAENSNVSPKISLQSSINENVLKTASSKTKTLTIYARNKKHYYIYKNGVLNTTKGAGFTYSKKTNTITLKGADLYYIKATNMGSDFTINTSSKSRIADPRKGGSAIYVNGSTLKNNQVLFKGKGHLTLKSISYNPAVYAKGRIYFSNAYVKVYNVNSGSENPNLSNTATSYGLFSESYIKLKSSKVYAYAYAKSTESSTQNIAAAVVSNKSDVALVNSNLSCYAESKKTKKSPVAYGINIKSSRALKASGKSELVSFVNGSTSYSSKFTSITSCKLKLSNSILFYQGNSSSSIKSYKKTHYKKNTLLLSI